MNGFSDSSVNWHDSASVFNHYDSMMKRYLKHNNISDFSKYEFSLHGHNPVFSKWEYPNLRKPCINRIKKLSNNTFDFDLEQSVEFTNHNVGIVRPQYIRIETSENDHFKSEKNFKTPLMGYIVTRTSSGTNSGATTSSASVTSSARAPKIINIIINPLRVEKIQNKWIFYYLIFAKEVCKIQVRFRMTYVYHTQDDDSEDSEEPDTVIVQTNVENEDLPSVEESPTIKSSIDMETESTPLRRSSSLRSSLKIVAAPSQLKDEFKIPEKEQVYYQLDEKTQKRLNKKTSVENPSSSKS